MRTYTLKAGNHYASGLHLGVHFGITSRVYQVTFSKECLYTPLDWENDYNKLCGWSYGMHHNNSIRACWRPFVPVEYKNDKNFVPNLLELCLYVYENGVRKISEKTLAINVNKTYTLDIHYNASLMIVLNIPEIGNSIAMDYRKSASMGYNLYPFFGGNLASPHDMTIKLNRL